MPICLGLCLNFKHIQPSRSHIHRKIRRYGDYQKQPNRLILENKQLVDHSPTGQTKLSMFCKIFMVISPITRLEKDCNTSRYAPMALSLDWRTRRENNRSSLDYHRSLANHPQREDEKSFQYREIPTAIS